LEMNTIKARIVSVIKKYKYAVAIVLIGLILIMIPPRHSTEEKSQTQELNDEKISSISEELTQILSQVDNAGKVEVLLTIESGEVTVYQTDDDTSVSDDNSTTQISTVLITGADREEYGLVRQINPPVYKGAIVVCQGADDPKVRLAIVDAVATVTGLGADRISVLKMK